MQSFYIVTAGILGVLIGFWSGRSLQWNIEETEESAKGTHEERKITEGRQLAMQGTVIGSPVTGVVQNNTETNAQEAKGDGEAEGAWEKDTWQKAKNEVPGKVCIAPEDGRVYAPTAGKVLKLYPMGNRIRFCTDSGIELLLEVCRDREELHSAYYHCNVVQNEVVQKGKLLMEFDRDSLVKEGVDTAVTLEMCQSAGAGQIVRTWKDHIRVGEELLWIQKKRRGRQD